MQIIDAQIHLWTKGRVVEPHRTTPYLLDEALADMDAAGVHGAILHPPSWDDASHAQALEAARLHPDRFAILGRIPLDAPARRGEIETWLAQPGVVGLRYTFLQPHMASWPHDGTMDWLWPAAERLSIPIALLAGEFLPLVGRIAERHPGLKLVVDHFGVRRGNKDAAAFATLPEVLALARHPNVAVKVTGGPQYVTDGWPFHSLRPRYEAIFDAFGPARMFWGTDITRMPCSWRECVTAFTEHQPWLSTADLEWVMGRGIETWLGWQRPSRPSGVPAGVSHRER
jgi:predicted TIM-barrel fold metal-dependent hydrolase